MPCERTSICDDDVKPAGDRSDPFHRCFVVRLVGRGELDDVHASWVLRRERVEVDRCGRVPCAGEDKGGRLRDDGAYEAEPWWVDIVTVETVDR
jgi:hypothetical protein